MTGWWLCQSPCGGLGVVWGVGGRGAGGQEGRGQEEGGGAWLSHQKIVVVVGLAFGGTF
jgi:hypothetical protein